MNRYNLVNDSIQSQKKESSNWFGALFDPHHRSFSVFNKMYQTEMPQIFRLFDTPNDTNPLTWIKLDWPACNYGVRDLLLFNAFNRYP
jgi:hypothetical protein